MWYLWCFFFVNFRWDSTLLGKEQQMQLKTYYLYYIEQQHQLQDKVTSQIINANQATSKPTNKHGKNDTGPLVAGQLHAIGRCNSLDPSPWLNRVSLHCFGSPKQWIWLDCISLRLSCSTPWNMEIQRASSVKTKQKKPGILLPTTCIYIDNNRTPSKTKISHWYTIMWYGMF